MSRTKTNKLIAVFMAICMAVALMSVALMTSAKAAETKNTASEEAGVSYTFASPELTKKEGKDHWYVADATKYEKAPVVDFKVDFDKKDGPDEIIQNPVNKIYSSVKFYSDEALSKEVEVTYTPESFAIKPESTAVKVDTSKVNGLDEDATYYMVLDKFFTKTKSTFEGTDIVVEFKVNKVETPAPKEDDQKQDDQKKSDDQSTTTTTTTTTTTKKTASTTKFTTRTTRTITTRKITTVKAKSANTDDPSHLPVWIGLAAVSALMLGAVYIAKEKE